MKPTKTPVFFNKNGDKSAYSLLCGYVQRRVANGRYKELYMEHSHYHVRSGKVGEKFELWEVFDSNQLTKARKYLRGIKL